MSFITKCCPGRFTILCLFESDALEHEPLNRSAARYRSITDPLLVKGYRTRTIRFGPLCTVIRERRQWFARLHHDNTTWVKWPERICHGRLPRVEFPERICRCRGRLLRENIFDPPTVRQFVAQHVPVGELPRIEVKVVVV